MPIRTTGELFRFRLSEMFVVGSNRDGPDVYVSDRPCYSGARLRRGEQSFQLLFVLECGTGAHSADIRAVPVSHPHLS